MTNTPNYNLKKPSNSDYYNIEDQNGNMDIIDTTMNTLSNIAIGKNLLDNPDFKINQRGNAQFSGEMQWIVDRWLNEYSVQSIKPIDKGIEVSAEHSTFSIRQVIEMDDSMFLEECVMSATYNGVRYTSNLLHMFSETSGVVMGPLTVFLTKHGGLANAMGIYVRKYNLAPGDKFTLADMKLELGPTATSFEPPDPVLELMKCQRYLRFRSTNNVNRLDLTPTMRINPSVYGWPNGSYVYVAEF